MGPRFEILTIGDELLRGELADSNAVWMAGQLSELGAGVRRIQSVGDGLEAIAEAISQATERSQVLLVTGGLGPTEDDRTAAGLASAAGVPVARDQRALDAIHERFAQIGLKYTGNNDKQADMPRGAEALINERGTAPGISMTLGGCQVFCMPGVPDEMRWMYSTYVAPFVQRILGGRLPIKRTCKVFGIGESQAAARLANWLEGVDLSGHALSLHYRATFPEVHITFVLVPSSGTPADSPRAEQLAEQLEGRIRQRLGLHVFGGGGGSFSEAVVGALRARGETVAVAESCTGGLVADVLTQAPGSSHVFELGVVAYANRVKQQLLGVPRDVINCYGAVSQQCVEAMARHVREIAGATFGLAISGIAGPSGGTEDKPVGTVHFALATHETVYHLHRAFPYDRQRNKLLAAYVGLWLVLRHVTGHLSRTSGSDSSGSDPSGSETALDELLSRRWSGKSKCNRSGGLG